LTYTAPAQNLSIERAPHTSCISDRQSPSSVWRKPASSDTNG
jgi:hypothetical protein